MAELSTRLSKLWGVSLASMGTSGEWLLPTYRWRSLTDVCNSVKLKRQLMAVVLRQMALESKCGDVDCLKSRDGSRSGNMYNRWRFAVGHLRLQ